MTSVTASSQYPHAEAREEAWRGENSESGTNEFTATSLKADDEEYNERPWVRVRRSGMLAGQTKGKCKSE